MSEDMGRHCELTDSRDSVEMSEVGFTGVEQFKDAPKDWLLSDTS